MIYKKNSLGEYFAADPDYYIQLSSHDLEIHPLTEWDDQRIGLMDSIPEEDFNNKLIKVWGKYFPKGV